MAHTTSASPEPDLIVPSHVGKRGSDASDTSDYPSRSGSVVGDDHDGVARLRRQSSAPPTLPYQVFMSTGDEGDIPTTTTSTTAVPTQHGDHESLPVHPVVNKYSPPSPSSRSCSQCQARCLPCSRTTPCHSCIRHGEQDLCDWSDAILGHAGPNRSYAHQTRPDSYPYPSSRPDSSSHSQPRLSPLPLMLPSSSALPSPSTTTVRGGVDSSTSPQRSVVTSPPLPRTAVAIANATASPSTTTPSTTNANATSGQVRVRVRNSCAQCHDRKIRCSRTYPCTGCSTRGNGLECNWEGGLPVSVSAADEQSLRAALMDVELRANALREKCLSILTGA